MRLCARPSQRPHYARARWRGCSCLRRGVLLCNIMVKCTINRLFFEQQKAGSAGPDISGVFELRNEGVFGTAVGDVVSRLGCVNISP
jgi:hypothetical protein